VAAVILLTADGGSSKSSSQDGGITTLPSPADMPPQTVALVSHMPRTVGTITHAQLDRAIAQSTAQAGLDSPPTPGSPKYDKTAESALGERLNSIWIQGEAAEMGFEVTPKEVAEEWEKLKGESFKSDDEYRKYLTEVHFTKADIDERVKVQILSTKIKQRLERNVEFPTNDEIARYYAANREAQFTKPAVGSAPAHVQPLAAVRGQIRRQLKQQAEQEDLANFVKRYNARWRSRTVCLPRYAVEDCSNGPAPAQASQSGGGEAAIPASP
jgi:hypothetical protein